MKTDATFAIRMINLNRKYLNVRFVSSRLIKVVIRYHKIINKMKIIYLMIKMMKKISHVITVYPLTNNLNT
jgi:hypothetical protein